MKILLIKSINQQNNFNIEAYITFVIKDHNKSLENQFKSLYLGDNKIDLIYGLGGKKIIDLTKYIASKLNCKYILIPTILEYDNIFSNKIIDLNDNFNKIDNLPEPTKILIDDNILKDTNFKRHASGWSIILSSLTACYCWRNYKSYFDLEYDQEMDFEINSCISKVSTPNNEENRKDLINTLKVFNDIEKAYSTNIFKISAEHYFVYNLNNYIDLKCEFGEALALGILVIAQMCNPGLAKKALHLMKKTGMNCILPSKKIIFETISTLKQFVIENNFNYSIINNIKFENLDINDIIDKVYLMIIDLNHSTNLEAC